MNPYNPYSFNSMYPQTLPQQNIISGQILQANGRESVNAVRMNPNSSAIICDSMLPVIYKCVSDSLGNVSISEFDVSPRKKEEETKQEQSNLIIADLVRRIERLENESNSKWSKSNNAEYEPDKTNDEHGKECKQSAGNGKPNYSKQS